MKNIKMFGKSVPIVVVVLASIFMLTASAVLVPYLSNPVSTETNIVSPIELDQSLFLFDEEGGYSAGTTQQLLLKVTNNADHQLFGQLDMHFEQYVGTEWVDFETPGIEVAISGDITYFYYIDPVESNWEDWMLAYPDWFDWHISGAYTITEETPSEPESSELNAIAFCALDGIDWTYAENDLKEPLVWGTNGHLVTTMQDDLPTGDFYLVFRVCFDPALTPTDYRLTVRAIPTPTQTQ